jgi:tRNA pseudouridine13 synthase
MSERMGADAFPNWIGPQRFGATRPVTPEVGRAVIEDDYKRACDLYLGMAGHNATEDVAAFRTMWRKTEDPQNCLEIIPRHLGYERGILERLMKDPENWLGAYKSLPHSLQLLTIHSLQSLTFNHALAGRLASGLSLVDPELGDLVAPMKSNGRIDVSKMALVSESNLERCRRNCKLGRLAVTGPLPGGSAIFAQGQSGEIEHQALEDTGLADADWNVSRIPRLTSSGTRRPLAVPFRSFSVEEAPELSDSSVSKKWEEGPGEADLWHPDGASLKMRFELPPGTYATVLMRELMKSPLDHY